jgi:hypothetical protein
MAPTLMLLTLANGDALLFVLDDKSWSFAFLPRGRGWWLNDVGQLHVVS